MQGLLQRVDAGDILVVTSELALAEALVKPLSDGKVELQQLYLETLQSGGGLSVAPIIRSTLIEAATLRAQRPVLKLPDAIHAATAIATGCSHFVTNDRRFADLSGLTVLSMEQL